MKARLFCRWGELKGADFEIGEEATVGREAGNQVMLDSPTVAGRHARIFFDEGEASYYVEDLGSPHGTQVDGVTVIGRERLNVLSTLSFGGSQELIFQVRSTDPVAVEEGGGAPTADVEVAAPAPSRPEVAAEPEVAAGTASPPAEPAASDGVSFRLEVGEGQEATSHDLRVGENVVGRSPRVEITIRAPGVSRRHARFHVDGGRVTLSDLGSRNHTYVDGEQIDGEVTVSPGQAIHFGRIGARLVR